MKLLTFLWCAVAAAIIFLLRTTTSEPIDDQLGPSLGKPQLHDSGYQPQASSTLKKFGVCLLLLLTSFILYEQISLAKKKRSLPGPWFLMPYFGSLFELVLKPYKYWRKQESWAAKVGASWNYLCGKFVLVVVTAKSARIPFIKNSKEEFLSTLHPNAKAVFGKDSILFMSGPKHLALRGSFIKLFTKKAISVYLSAQETIVRKFVEKWKHTKGELDFRCHLQEMNAYTSLATFLGPYIEDTEYVQQLMDTMGKAFIGVPIDFPGTYVWNTKRARAKVETILIKVVKQSKINMQEGKQPSCLLDFWSQGILEDIKKAEQNGESPPEHTSDYKMAITVMDFIFAAQDASTASLSHTMALMSDHPDVLEKVREEQYRVNASMEPITFEMLNKMTYTRQVVKEILRLRPPVPLYAHVAMKNMELENGHVAPKGCLVFSSITAACREDFTDPDKFDPDRMSTERREDIKHCTNFLVFGAGPHKCAGQEYAMNHMVVFLSVLSTNCTWVRRRTAKSDELKYMPSAFPADLFITFNSAE